MATIVTRTTGATAKGSELSFTELDNNFINLNSDKYEANDSPTFATVTAADVDTADFSATGTASVNVMTVETFTSTAIDDNSTQGSASVTFEANGQPTFSSSITTTNNAIVMKSSGTHSFVFNDTTADRGKISYDNVDNSMKLITEGTFAIHIDSSQQVGIGTDIPSSALDVAGDIECVNLTATTQVTAADFNTTSDYRVKENVVGVDEVSELIDYLNVVEFNFKDNPEQKQVGFIAHELQSVIPGVVTGEKDGEELQTINMTKLVPYLVKALQESNAKIKQLEEKISELK